MLKSAKGIKSKENGPRLDRIKIVTLGRQERIVKPHLRTNGRAIQAKGKEQRLRTRVKGKGRGIILDCINIVTLGTQDLQRGKIISKNATRQRVRLMLCCVGARGLCGGN